MMIDAKAEGLEFSVLSLKKGICNSLKHKMWAFSNLEDIYNVSYVWT